MAKPIVDATMLELFRRYGAEHGAWGSLHIVLDDGNLEDSSVEFCIKYARKNDDKEGEWLATLLLAMSRTQRGKIARFAR